MGVALTIDGADYSANPTGLLLPAASDALLYANFFGDAAGNQSRNLAPGRAGGLVTGAITPTANNQAGQFNAANFVDTGIPDQDAVTLVSVARQTSLSDGTFAYAIGSYLSDTRAGANVLFSPQSPHPTYALAGYTGTNGVGQVFSVGQAPSTQFSFTCTRTSSAYGISYDNKSGGGGQNVVGLPGPRRPSNTSYLIGRAPVEGQFVNGNVEIAFAAIFGRVLSDAELDAIYQRIRRILPRTNAGLAI
jgi:hypothetical protein